MDAAIFLRKYVITCSVVYPLKLWVKMIIIIMLIREHS